MIEWMKEDNEYLANEVPFYMKQVEDFFKEVYAKDAQLYQAGRPSEMVAFANAMELQGFIFEMLPVIEAGEVKGRKVEGFDVGNSPADIVAKGEPLFSGRSVAARSSAGTQGVLAAASRAQQVILGSYLNAAATATYIRDAARVDAMVHGHDVTVTLVAMGFEGVTPSIEDERCADYLEHLLIGTPYDHVQAVWDCMHDEDIAASLRGEHDYRSREDIILALQRDVLDFAMIGRLEDSHVRVTRRNIR